MNNTLPIMAAPYIVGELGGSNDIAFYAVTFYSIGNALGVPLGRLAVGRANPASFFFSLLILSAFLSLLIAAAPTYPYFLILRLLKGICAGFFFPMISDLFVRFDHEATKEKKDRIAYTIVTIFTVAPAFSASIGGWISYDYHWQWLFYGDIPIFIVLGILLFSQLRYTAPKQEKTPFDDVGYIFYMLSILGLGLAITMGQQLDWHRSFVINALFFIGGSSFLFFIVWSLAHPFPILDFRLLKNFVFSFALFQLIFLFSAYFGMVILLAFWLNLWVNYTPIWIGFIMGTMAFAGFLPRLLFSKKWGYIDSRIPLACSIFLLAFSCWHTTYFNVETDLWRIALSRVIAGCGLAFFLTPIFRLCFHTFPFEKTSSVIGFFQAARVLASGLGAAFYLTLWQRRQTFFHDRLGSQLSPFSVETGDYFARAKIIGLNERQSIAELGNLLDRQSIALALDDCFYLMSWILVGLFISLIFTYLFRCKGFKPEA